MKFSHRFRFFTGLLTLSLMGSLCFNPVSAEAAKKASKRTAAQIAAEKAAAEQIEAERQAAYNKDIDSNAINGWPQGPQIYAESAIVMEASSGAILYNKDMDMKNYPASITKIMTALLTLENCSLDETVTYSYNATHTIDAGSSSIYTTEDEQLTVEQSLYALMLESANECANGLAEHVAGSIDAFAEMMNQKAQELGCTNTVFTNPTGLPDDNQHTTAHDMALIMQAAIQNESFRTIAAATSYTIPATNMAAARNLTSKFTMTDTGSTGFYEGCIGGKEGYTEASGSTLVCAAQRDGMTLISVVLKGVSGQTAPDAASILNYGFDQFTTLSLGDSDFSIISGGDVVVPAGTTADSLATEDTQNGDEIDRTYLFNGTAVGSAVLEVAQSEDTASVQTGEQNMQAAKDYSENHTEVPYFVIAGVFLLLLILLIWRIVKVIKA